MKTRELNKGLPQEEQDYKLELAIEHTLAFFPLLETNPKGHMNLFYVISSPNTDPVYRSYLINRTYPSGMPETLFSQYLQDACIEDNGEIMNRFSTLILEKKEHPMLQHESLKAFMALTEIMIVRALSQDREVMRVATQNAYKINTALLKEHPEIRMLENTPELIKNNLSRLDSLMLEIQKYFGNEFSRPDWLKVEMLNAMENAIENYILENDPKHREFLIAQGRDVPPPSLDKINAENAPPKPETLPVEIIKIPDAL